MAGWFNWEKYPKVPDTYLEPSQRMLVWKLSLKNKIKNAAF